jgi:hypothetical protein
MKLHYTIVIQWSNEDSCFLTDYDGEIENLCSYVAKTREIIGNIYENPELLEG